MLADQLRELPLAKVVKGHLCGATLVKSRGPFSRKGRPAFDQLADSKALEALFYVAVLIFTLITLGLAVVLRESPPL